MNHFDFTNDSNPAVLKRALYMFHDIAYLLSNIPNSEDDWSDKLRISFVKGVYFLLAFFYNFESMDEIKRQDVEHQLMESEWETAFGIFLQMQESVSLVIAWANTDAYVHQTIFNFCLQFLRKKYDFLWVSNHDYYHRRIADVEVNSYKAICINYDVTKNAVSIHHPLWRFLAGLFTAPPSILTNYYVDEYQENIVEYNIHNDSLIKQMDPVVAATMDPNNFLIRVLEKFGLLKWAEVGFEDSQAPNLISGTPATPSATPEELSKILVNLAEEFLHLLIIILGERYNTCIGICTDMEILQREILHLLCTGPKPFSHIEKFMPLSPKMAKLSLVKAVRDVADFRQPASTTSGMFYLKQELLSQYNSFFYHYSKTQLSQAEQTQKKERENKDRTLIACPPPLLPKFQPFYSPIIRIFSSGLFVKLLRIVFERYVKRSRFSSEGLLHRALFLTGIALQEQRLAWKSGIECNFLELAEKEEFLSSFNKLQSKSDIPYSDLLWWTIQVAVF